MASGSGTTAHDSNDFVGAAGIAGGLNGHGAVNDFASLQINEDTVARLEASGQGDSAMADAARVGAQAARTKITIGVVIGGVVALLILVGFIFAMNAQRNFNDQVNQMNQQFQNNFPGTQSTCYTFDSEPSSPTTVLVPATC